MVDKKIIITISVVVTLIVVAAVVIPTSIILTKNNDDDKIGPSGSSEDPTPSPTPTNSPTNTPTNTPTITPTVTPNPNGLVSLKVSKIRYVQTHVLPAEGLSWSLPKKNASLHLVGGRDTLLLVDYIGTVPNNVNPKVQIFAKDASTPATTLTLNPPNQLPPTESNGTKYSTTSYSVRISPNYIKPGMKVIVSTDASGTSLPNVGQDSTMRLQILPMYMFGANSTNSQPYNQVKLPDTETIKETYQTWPIAKLDVTTHPVGMIQSPFAIIPASDGGHAYRITNSEQMRSGYVLMSWVLGILSGLRNANGESSTNTMYYTPLMALDSKGKSVHPGGGLGGGWRGTGDWSYTGIFIHEAGHSWGLPHSGEAYTGGSYPYIQGSLLGSQWGFNFDKNEFLSIYVPVDADYYPDCAKSHVVDNGKCVKQDAMQGGSGDQSPDYKFTMFPDFDLGVMQQNMEGITTINKKGEHVISDNLLSYDSTSGKYVQWDSIDKKYVDFVITNESNALYGMDAGLPMIRNTDVYAVIIQYNLAATSTCTTCSAIYPPIKYKGNLLRYIDPTVQSQIDLITPNTGDLAWFCHASGCDFTLRATYKDGSTYTKILQTGLRDWFSPLGAEDPAYRDPNSGDSIVRIVENIPAAKVIAKIELFWTPQGFSSVFNPNSQVLISETY